MSSGQWISLIGKVCVQFTGGRDLHGKFGNTVT